MSDGSTSKSSQRRRKGQVLVEIVLVLPVFLFLMFLVMEICNVCFQTLVAHHLAFECAHGAALAAGPSNYGTGESDGLSKAQSIIQDKAPGRATVTISTENTLYDSQPAGAGHQTKDLIVTLHWPVRFLFPGMKSILKLGGVDNLDIAVPMSVEYPAYG